VLIGQPRNIGLIPCGSNGFFFLLQIVQLVLGPTHFPTQMLPEAASPEVRRPGHKTDQSPTFRSTATDHEIIGSRSAIYAHAQDFVASAGLLLSILKAFALYTRWLYVIWDAWCFQPVGTSRTVSPLPTAVPPTTCGPPHRARHLRLPARIVPSLLRVPVLPLHAFM